LGSVMRQIVIDIVPDETGASKKASSTGIAVTKFPAPCRA